MAIIQTHAPEFGFWVIPFIAFAIRKYNHQVALVDFLNDCHDHAMISDKLFAVALGFVLGSPKALVYILFYVVVTPIL